VEAEGHFGVRLVFEEGVLEVFSHGVSTGRFRAGDPDVRIQRMPATKAYALAVRFQAPGGASKMLPFSEEQAGPAEELLRAFEAYQAPA
jgi:hypothetical protein